MSKVFETSEICYKHSEGKYELRIDYLFCGVQQATSARLKFRLRTQLCILSVLNYPTLGIS